MTTGLEEGADVNMGQQTHLVSSALDNSNTFPAPGIGLGSNDNGLEIVQVLGEGLAAKPSS